MKFCTVINCMDGRVQLPVINYLKEKYNTDFVDSITEAGPNLVLFEQENLNLVNSILDKLKISVEKHNSGSIAIVGHYDCAGNPSDYNTQVEHLKKSVEFIQNNYKNLEVIGLWVNENWEVSEI